MPLITQNFVLNNWTGDTQDYPTIEPSLRLDFANARALDPRITFTRASTATYVGRDGQIKTAGEDEARFDHDPTTGESLGLLIEESRTNIVTHSQEFNNAYWSKNGGGNPGTTVTADQAVAPDGTTTADYIDYTTATTNSQLIEKQFDNTPAGKTYTGSVWIKGTSGQTINVILDGYGVDVTGEQYTLDGTWQRLTITRTYGPTFSAGALFRFGVRPLGLSAGTATQVYAWGAQIEEGSFPTSYIPTSGSTATRAADLPYIEGTSFSGWYNSEGGAYVLDVMAYSYSGSFFGFGTSSYLESFNVSNSGGTQFYVPGNYNTSNAYTGNMNLDQSNKIGASFNSTGQRVCSNGQSVNASGFTPPATSLFTDFDRLSFGGNIPWDKTYTSQRKTHVKSFSYYTKYLSDAQLQTLTQ